MEAHYCGVLIVSMPQCLRTAKWVPRPRDGGWIVSNTNDKYKET
jgi:hypothetical protein